MFYPTLCQGIQKPCRNFQVLSSQAIILLISAVPCSLGRSPLLQWSTILSGNSVKKRFSVYSRNFCQLTAILKLCRAQDGTIKCKQGKAREVSWDLLQRSSNWLQQNCYLKHLFNNWILHSQLKCTKNPIFQMEQDMSGLYFCLNLVLEITPCCYFECLNSDITYHVPPNTASHWK